MSNLVSVVRKDLVTALSIAKFVQPKRSNKEILMTTKLALNGNLKLSSTDTENYLEYTIETDNPVADATTCIPTKQLETIAKISKSKTADLSIDSEISLSVDSQKLYGEKPAEFPNFNFKKHLENEELTFVRIDADELAESLEYTVQATDKESTRYQLGGVCFELMADDRMILIATDGRRLHLTRHNSATSGDDPKATAILTAHAVEAVVKLCKHAKTVLIGASNESNHLYFRFSNDDANKIDGTFAELSCRVVEGRFPAWRKVMLTKTMLCATLPESAKKTIDNLSKAYAKQTSKTDYTYAIDVKINGDEMTLTPGLNNSGSQWQFTEKMAVSNQESLNVLLDVRYFGQAIPKDLICDLIISAEHVGGTYKAQVEIKAYKGTMRFEAAIMAMSPSR